jgi:hypothetical protein
MHKSTYKLRLFLMALILSTVGAVIPMGNMNIFENAIAITQGYNYNNYSNNTLEILLDGYN